MDHLIGDEDTILNNRNKTKAELYLRERHIMSLVNHLTATLLFHKPDDPVVFVIRQVEEIIDFRDNQSKPPILFDGDHLVNIFKGIDFLNSGTIDLKQYFDAMNNMLGLNDNDFNPNPQKDENGRITCEVFTSEAKFALIKQMNTMILHITTTQSC